MQFITHGSAIATGSPDVALGRAHNDTPRLLHYSCKDVCIQKRMHPDGILSIFQMEFIHRVIVGHALHPMSVSLEIPYCIAVLGTEPTVGDSAIASYVCVRAAN